MSIPRNLAAILSEHTTLEIESIDRMYLHFYVPILQREAGIAHFFQSHRGHRFVSSTQMGPMSRAFVKSIKRFANCERIPLVRFRRMQRKEEVAKEYLKAFKARKAYCSLAWPRDLRAHVADFLGEQFTQDKMSYDLRRLRLHGMDITACSGSRRNFDRC